MIMLNLFVCETNFTQNADEIKVFNKLNEYSNIMTTTGNTNISTNESIHASNKIQNLSLTLTKTNKTINNARDSTCKDSIHGDLLRNDVSLNADLVLGETHVYEYMPDENKHYS